MFYIFISLQVINEKTKELDVVAHCHFKSGQRIQLFVHNKRADEIAGCTRVSLIQDCPYLYTRALPPPIKIIAPCTMQHEIYAREQTKTADHIGRT